MCKNNCTKIMIIVLVTTLLGEFYITPFASSFRFGLGSAGFFFLLLLYKDVSYLWTGFLTGVFATFFRTLLDFFQTDSFIFSESLMSHFPIIMYYFLFAFILHVYIRKIDSPSPFMLGILGATSDAAANMGELFLHLLVENIQLFPNNIGLIFFIAFFRSFFVVGLYNMIESNKLKAVYQEQQTRFEHIQTILSELYIEVFYLKKTLAEIEHVTMKAHDLYQELKRMQTNMETSRLALSIAQEVHEVKKDNQRILAGLEKVIHQKNTLKPFFLSDIIHLCVSANKKYIKYLQKDIKLNAHYNEDIKIKAIYPLLIIQNNLVSNAIEAIADKGVVTITIRIDQRQLIMEISDNGCGIDLDEQRVIFEPGFTTKFSKTGKPSNGIGLSHVKLMVEELHGNISLHSGTDLTTFTVSIPIECLV